MQERTGTLSGAGGLKLYTRTWIPDQAHSGLVLVHGTNEHIGRYEHVARFFADQGFAVYGMDHRGYGQSEGTRCYVDRFEDYVEDLHQLVRQAQAAYGEPLMIGHSLGGLIGYRYAVTYPETLRAVVLSSPFFATKVEADPVSRALAPLLSRLIPRLQLKVPFGPETVSRDPEVVRKYAEDPLVWKKITPRWFTECARAATACHKGLEAGLKLPALFLQAGDDQLVDPEATRAIYEQVPHQQKAFKLYAGKYHEIFNDPGQEAVFADILNWVREQELAPAE